jgi:hypothetical protein
LVSDPTACARTTSVTVAVFPPARSPRAAVKVCPLKATVPALAAEEMYRTPEGKVSFTTTPFARSFAPRDW